MTTIPKAKHLFTFANIIEMLREGIEDANLGKTKLSDDVQVVFLTSSCQIRANIQELSTPYENSSDTEKVLSILNSALNNIFEGKETPESIHLKNVTVQPFSNPNQAFALEYLCLYADQIVGVSFGVQDSLE